MYNFFNILIDFIFPPNKNELKLRSLSPEDFLKISPKSQKTEFPFIKSVFSYKEPLVRELIWQIKYKKNKNALKIAGYVLYKELIRTNKQTLLLAIPISNKRRKERGYNQCELIINEVTNLDVNHMFVKDFSILKRMKHIEKQTFMKRNERLNNIKNIFEVSQNRAQYKNDIHILIIDDVSTTGSTLKEARDILLQSGFTNVQALTIAH